MLQFPLSSETYIENIFVKQLTIFWVVVNELIFLLDYCRMKHDKTKGKTVEDTPEKEQKKLIQSAENQDNFLKFIAEIIVEIIIKETVHENNSTHQKDG